MTHIVPYLLSLAGWLGAAELLWAYVLISSGRLAGDSLKYQALNISGSIMLMANCASSGAWPSVIANLFYLVVGINVLLTVKRAYIAGLVRREAAAVSARWQRPGQTRMTGATTDPAARALPAPTTEMAAMPAGQTASSAPAAALLSTAA
ncbi:CBU_0592 family membrane protein [Actinomyces marmotae]|uniref:CBU_0592 family membrane protein n=1 Tax=Actinomyces marmotae TaxID=2737173 RepID=UPI0039A40D30